ncbi:MAG: hypothetical protein A2Y45_00075 [Tenericutes bacterium GWC2_34_14]|nr:MAG: hypothetical protein A2Y45_00075 [Tenericutes bacterium GWC2_34_14]OHE34398.1 MAG: hypothetical protein A2012_07695 [Tenericutes bacterium GWE2_34_108]OHE35754.1 MAG: hypothetical protein A2Y46_02400 [Tenericutes bacterium GWF1_35_14]OHE39159.1 MAG: hypothetical protein A2Y44_07530 [Tenericutes bacterium GWF2_35_184]OHE42356.1 MAG: hypothetical protein A3K26_04810 [Tenericutes bacterium RIFOXYA12_FULL_35_10]OHE42774.1 MAG: hypothetical protein A2221_08705 [Tenericutes bacterium RIFOXYA
MKRNLLKKCMIGIIMVSFLFLFVKHPDLDYVVARDLSGSTSWMGDDLTFDTLQPVNYASPYRYFETIIDHPELIDLDLIYVIENATDLYHFSRLTRGAYANVYLSLDYVLGNDIDYYDAVLENINYTFSPIGFTGPFTGSFDGQGFEITNLYFTSILDEETYELSYPGLKYLSMFSHISSSAKVHHFGLINPIMIQPIEWGMMSHASYIAGLNQGQIDHVYVIDERLDASGMHVDGAFHIAGLVSENQGIMNNMWIASPYVRSRAVTHAFSVHPLVTSNTGTMLEVYYDQSIYAESVSSMTDRGLLSTEFQQALYFSEDWYFNDAYHLLVDSSLEYDQVLGHSLYPSLHGLDVLNQELLINKPVDLVIMQELLIRSGYFRKSTYMINKDLDMSSLSQDAYQAKKVSFNGVLSSHVITQSHTLYEHLPSDGGTPSYYTIFNLSLTKLESQFDYDSIGLFNVLFGEVSHLNLRDVKMNIDLGDVHLDSLKMGFIAGEMIDGLIHDIHITGDIDITGTKTTMNNVMMGGLIGEGSGIIQRSSITGSNQSTTLNHATTLMLYQGGLVGKAYDLTIDQAIGNMNIQSMYSTDLVSQTSYVGGIVGYGNNIELFKLIHQGEITNNPSIILNSTIFLGGIFGLVEDRVMLEDIFQQGSIHITPNTTGDIKLHGIGQLNQSVFNLLRITHAGLMNMDTTLLTHTENQRYSQLIDLSLGLGISDSTGQIEGLYNQSNISYDSSYVDRYSGLLIAENSLEVELFHAENKGDVIVTSTALLTHNAPLYTMIAQGDNINFEHLRNEGDLSVHLTHNQSSSYLLSEFSVSGLVEKISDGYTAKHLYNGGNIVLSTNGFSNFSNHVYVSGIALSHENTSYSMDRGIDPYAIDFQTLDGSLHNVLNHGDITLEGNFLSHVYASGIVVKQKGLMTSAISLGDINTSNLASASTSHVSSSGLSSLLIGSYATIMDSANYGTITAQNMSTTGSAHAAGIAIRNDLKEDLTLALPTDNHHLSKIAFSINYGDVYAWSETVESSNTIDMESKVKASGILAMGVLSVVNNVNFGHIASKYTAAGFISLIPLNHFGTLPTDQVYMSNLIQYGEIRVISSYDWVEKSYTELTSMPTRTPYYAFGAIVGKIHTGTTTWAFAGDVTYPIDRIYFGYLINFDATINMFDNAPELSSSWADGFGNLQEANDVILNMLAYMGTSNPNDNSKAPFTYFFQGGWVGQYMGKVIDHYTISDAEGGFFHESFAFRSSRPIYSGTDQYIHDYIAYIDSTHVNPELLDDLETQTGQTFPGFYALSSSEGINEGIFMPDNLEMTSLHPYDAIEETLDTSWLGTADDPNSIAYALYTKMRQTRASFAATIYDLELTQTDSLGNLAPNGLTLNSPVIDETRKLVTYYLPSNAEILNQTSSSLMNVYRFIEVSDGLGRKVPDVVVSGEQTYSWIGDYKKSGENFVEIGPYNTLGTTMVSTTDLEPYASYNRNTPVYSQTLMAEGATLSSLFKHTPHTYVFFWWQASGYRITPTTGYASGYGAYQPYTLSGYPTLYRYVGPSTENVTYIKTDVEENVVIFNDANIYFGVDASSDAHVISQGASLSYQGLTDQEVASVPRSYGVYEAMYDSNGLYIDSVVDHYGSVRVFSASYDPLDPASYQDYDIRIIRTADQSLSSIDVLTVSGLNGLPVSPNVFDVASTQSMLPIDSFQKGSVTFSYQTMNMADLQKLKSNVSVYDTSTGLILDDHLYEVTQGINQTSSVFDNQTGSWGSGYVSFEVLFDEMLPSGFYDINTTLITGDVYVITFEKLMSNQAHVLSLTYQGVEEVISGTTLTSSVAYGLFYDPNLSETKPVNFTNLQTLIDIDDQDLSTNLPSYLDHMDISSFSKIQSISLAIDMVDSVRHRYQITYYLVAEDLTTSTFTHIIIENSPSLTPQAIYDNGSRVFGVSFDINYNEAPTFRVNYDLTNVFIHTDSPWQITSTFTPLNIGEEAILHTDYVMTSIPDSGYEVDFTKDTPMGDYEITVTYHQEMMLWGETLIWDITYPTMTYHKLKNDQSMLEDILFVSDAVFQGFNTIIDPSLITSERYSYLLQNPSERLIVQLPTTGIVYLDSGNLPSYYIIGQVQQTHLSYYMPTMMIPDGATIKRVVDDINIGPEYQSDNLYADYSPLGDDFNFIRYRVYAMDYDIDPTHYTDYYVAVQDMTNMIRFDVTIQNDALIPVEDLHIRISICQNGEGNETCVRDNEILSMGIFSSYINGSYTHPVFQTTTYGTYKVEVYLPDGYTYTIQIAEVVIIGNAFYVENSIFPRKVYMTLTISDQIVENPWGIEALKPLEP